ncbi:ABC transporter permease [Anaerobium acetethylicum]|nr:hypothetical protein [Anaerobium acetethylicum]
MNEKKNKLVYYAQDFGALIALALLIIGISIVSPEFRTVDNFFSLLRQSSINGLIAFGMTFVILTDAIDLSVGSVLALSTALCAGMITAGVPVGLAMLLSLVIGALLGLVSGLLVTKGRLQPELMGQTAIEVAKKLLAGETVEKSIPVEVELITK